MHVCFTAYAVPAVLVSRVDPDKVIVDGYEHEPKQGTNVTAAATPLASKLASESNVANMLCCDAVKVGSEVAEPLY